MQTTFEWDLEEVDSEGDVLDHHHQDKLVNFHGNALDPDDNLRLVLVKNVWDETKQSLHRRAWAYVEKQKLPSHFDSGDIVPARFHKELAAYKAGAK